MPTAQLIEDITGAYERLTEDELGNLGIVLGAYRSFRGNRRKHIAYVSMPITTGRRYYDVLSQHGVRTREELAEVAGPDALYELVIKHNIREGIAFADGLGYREDLLFIAPSVFEARPWRWTEDAYMSLWYRVMGELAGQHRVMDGWEYSTGGLKEVLFAMFMQWRIIRRYNFDDAVRIFNLSDFMTDLTPEQQLTELEGMWSMRVFDAVGDEITIDRALVMAVTAIDDLVNHDLPYDELLEPAYRLMQVPVLSPLWRPEAGPSDPFTPAYCQARESLGVILGNVERSS